MEEGDIKIDYDEKLHLDRIHPPAKPKANGKEWIKSRDYFFGSQQIGWSVDQLKDGKDSSPFICSICLGVPKFPMEVLTCGDSFCFDCIGEYLLRTMKEKSLLAPFYCPNCKEEFEEDDIVYFQNFSKALYRVFTSIDVRCSYGCGLVMSTKSLIKHEMWECTKRPVKCPNNCRQLLPDDEMDGHIGECDHRLVICNKCKQPKLFSEKKHPCVKALTDTINCK